MGYQTRRQEVCQAPKSSLLMRPPHGLSDQTTRSLSGTQELSSHEAPTWVIRPDDKKFVRHPRALFS
ncbi:hypothetical protein RRG08_032955 [Elysia crispata]|nr:hypothetical protein RRG08_032955 [Elysia crispata]